MNSIHIEPFSCFCLYTFIIQIIRYFPEEVPTASHIADSVEEYMLFI